MFEVINIEDKRWDIIVNSFVNADVYYMRGYVVGFQLQGDGQPLLLYYEKDGTRGICAVLRREIGDSNLFDIITPYGYGGFLWEGDLSEAILNDFKSTFYETMKNAGIVSAFFRYHPLLHNADVVRTVLPIIDLGKTIDIELKNRDKIFENFTSKNRNTIRKAQKNGVTIFYGKGMELLDKFIPIYNSTMERDNASPYYYFGREYYKSIEQYLCNNYLVFYAEYEGKIVAMSIILLGSEFMHYHLSGSLAEFKHLAPSNLLLYEVALWGAEQGFQKFHLGGGVGSAEDGLFKFKQSFNRNSANQFSIGKMIFDLEKYNGLVDEQISNTLNFDKESHFFPLYRA